MPVLFYPSLFEDSCKSLRVPEKITVNGQATSFQFPSRLSHNIAKSLGTKDDYNNSFRSMVGVVGWCDGPG